MTNRSASTRAAQIADASEMARLAGELGYPVSADELARRLADLLPDARHHIAVVAGERSLLGWIHVERRLLLSSGERCEIIDLVVDATVRRHGLGSKLVALTEKWTQEHGVLSLTVRSNAARVMPHPFYESLGYQRSKTQHVYTKAILRR